MISSVEDFIENFRAFWRFNLYFNNFKKNNEIVDFKIFQINKSFLYAEIYDLNKDIIEVKYNIKGT